MYTVVWPKSQDIKMFSAPLKVISFSFYPIPIFLISTARNYFAYSWISYNWNYTYIANVFFQYVITILNFLSFIWCESYFMLEVNFMFS